MSEVAAELDPQQDPRLLYGNLVNSYYSEDRTQFIEEYQDGTKLAYAVDPNDNQFMDMTQDIIPQQQAGNYDPITGNPIGNEFYGTDNYMQQYQYAHAYDQGAGANSGYPQQQQLQQQPPTPRTQQQQQQQNGQQQSQQNAGGDQAADAAGDKKKKKRHSRSASAADTAGGDGGDIATTAVIPGDDPAGAQETLHGQKVQTSGIWIVDVCSEAFFSLAFKLWACQIFMTTVILTFFYGLNIEYGILYRMVAPPELDNSMWQSLAYAILFVVFSFFIVTFITCEISIIREMWISKPTDKRLFGIGMGSAQPPYFAHIIMILALTVLPVLWSMILTLSYSRTAAYFAQFVLFNSVLIGFFLVLIVYVLMWVQAFRLKTTAYHDREKEVEKSRKYKQSTEEESDDPELDNVNESDLATDSEDSDRTARKKRRQRRKLRRRKSKARTIATNARGDRINMVSAFDSERTLQEFGLDPTVVRWMIAVFAIGWLPVIVVIIATVFDEAFPEWNLIWVFIGIVVFLAFVGLAEVNIHMRSKTATLVSIIYVVIFVIVGLIACGLSNPNLIGIYIVLLACTHAMLLRKRPYAMLPHEIESKFGPSVDQYGTGEYVDSYLCLCRNTILTFLSCCGMCDVQGTFGRKPPQVLKFEKEYRRKHFALITDQRLLMYHWIALWILMAVAVSFGKQLTPILGVPMAEIATPVNGTDSGNWICNVKFNTNYTQPQLYELHNSSTRSGRTPAKASLGMLDLAYMNLVSYSTGDFARFGALAYFDSYSTLQINQQEFIGGTTAAVARERIRWVDYYDNVTNFHFITVTGIPRAVGFMRAVDAYGEWFVLKAAEALTPFVAAWPVEVKRSWVDGTGFFKRWMKGGILDYIKPLEEKVAAIQAEGPNVYGAKPQVVLIGGGFNGAWARAIAHRRNVRSVAFSSAGTEYMHKAFDMGTPIMSSLNHFVINTDTDAYNLIGGHGYADSTHVAIPCDLSREDRSFSPKCSKPQRFAAYFRDLCGDQNGVVMHPVVASL